MSFLDAAATAGQVTESGTWCLQCPLSQLHFACFTVTNTWDHRVLKPLSPFAGSGLGQAMKTIPCGFCISHSQTVNLRSFTALQGLCKVLRESKEARESVQEKGAAQTHNGVLVSRVGARGRHCSDMDRPGDGHARCSKSGKDKQRVTPLTRDVWNKKQLNLPMNQKQTHRPWEQTPGCWGVLGGRDGLGVWD